MHWFWRGAVALTGMALLISARAYAPAFRFLIELSLVSGLIVAVRWWRERENRSDRAKLPDELPELVPTYLPSIPRDPHSGNAFVYRPISQTEYMLYSIGPNRKDDGGKPISRREMYEGQNGDVFLDMKEY